MFSRVALLARVANTHRSFFTSSVALEQTPFLMPALSPTMTEGKVSGWLIKEGDSFTAGQPLLSIETDKATMDVEAAEDGILAKILMDENSGNIEIGNPIAILAEEGDDLSSITIPEKTPATLVAATPAAIPASAPAPAPATTTHGSQAPGHISGLFSPSAYYLINSNRISNYSQIKATGSSGRVMKSDVLEFIASNKAEFNLPPVSAPLPPAASTFASAPKSTPTPEQLQKAAPANKSAAGKTQNATSYLVQALSPSAISLLNKLEFEKTSTTTLVSTKKIPKSHGASLGASLVKAIATTLDYGKSGSATSSIAVYLNSSRVVTNSPTYLNTNDAATESAEEIAIKLSAEDKNKNPVGETVFSVILNFENELPQQLMSQNVLLVGVPFKKLSAASISQSLESALNFVTSKPSPKPSPDEKSSSKETQKLTKTPTGSVRVQLHTKDSATASKSSLLLKGVLSTVSAAYA